MGKKLNSNIKIHLLSNILSFCGGVFLGFQIRFKYSSVVSFLCTGSAKLRILLSSRSHREIRKAGYNTSTHFSRILPVDGPVTVLTCTACSRRSSKIPVVGYVWRDRVTPKSAAELSSSMSKRNVSLMPAFLAWPYGLNW